MNYIYRIKYRIREEGVFYTFRYVVNVFLNGVNTLIKNVILDLKYSRKILNGNQKSPYKHLGANDTYHTDYSAMPLIFKQIDLTSEDILVDVGCGKGRIINYWLSQGLKNKIIGLELDPEITAQTASQFSKYKNISIVPGDAIENLPQEGTVFYFYNPFTLEKVYEFEKKLYALSHHKTVMVIYYNPKSIEVFDNNKWNVKYINFEKDLGKKRWGRINKYHDLAIIKRNLID